MGKIKKTKKFIRAEQERKGLHAKYICGIVLSVALLCVVLSAYNHETFIAQFSFAGTVASTVLSIIAIWVSISKEKETAEIQGKISASANRLKKITKKAKSANVRQEKSMDSQLTQLEEIREKLSLLLDFPSQTKTESSISLRKSTSANSSPCESVKQPPSADQLWTIFENIYSWIREDGQNQQSLQIFCRMLQTVIRCHESQNTYTLSAILSQLDLTDVQSSELQNVIHAHWGAINTLIAAGILNSQETRQKISEKIQKAEKQN